MSVIHRWMRLLVLFSLLVDVCFQSVDEFIQRVVGKVWVEVLEAEYTPLQRRLCV